MEEQILIFRTSVKNVRDGWDPEASRKVETFGRYPFTRNLTVGLNLTF